MKSRLVSLIYGPIKGKKRKKNNKNNDFFLCVCGESGNLSVVLKTIMQPMYESENSV